MIEEDYVSFETAKLLKEKGFTQKYDIFHSPVYVENDYEDEYEVDRFVVEKCTVKAGTLSTYPAGIPGPKCYCPTLQMAMKWLLETYNIFITILQTEHTTVTQEQEYFFYRIQKNRRSVGVFTDTFMKPEQACEAGIKYCLENLI